MNVRELISELSEVDGELDVCLYQEGDAYVVNHVYEETPTYIDDSDNRVKKTAVVMILT